MLLKPLDYRDPDRIVSISTLWKRTAGHGQVSAPDFHDWHDQSTAFSAMAYYTSGQTAIMAGPAAEYALVADVTPEFFRVFDLQPQIGRFFTPEEEQEHGAGAAVVSYSFWQNHYGGAVDVLGRSVRLQEQTLRIVGVLPPRFHFPGRAEIWCPALLFGESQSRSAHNYRVVGCLKPDITLEQAQAQMISIAARLEQQYPASNKEKGAVVTRMHDELVGDVRATLYLLLGAVSLVLLIACANVANLLLAKATARTREIAIRAAVGASRGRIVRQLVVESAVLALASGAAGLLVAYWWSSALVALAPGDTPRLAETALDGAVLAYTFLLSLVASVLFGLAPALQMSRVDLNESLKHGAARSGAAGATGRLRSAFVVAKSRSPCYFLRVPGCS